MLSKSLLFTFKDGREKVFIGNQALDGASLEEGIATHSSILAWRIPRYRGARRAAIHGVSELDTTERLSPVQHRC